MRAPWWGKEIARHRTDMRAVALRVGMGSEDWWCVTYARQKPLTTSLQKLQCEPNSPAHRLRHGEDVERFLKRLHQFNWTCVGEYRRDIDFDGITVAQVRVVLFVYFAEDDRCFRDFHDLGLGAWLEMCKASARETEPASPPEKSPDAIIADIFKYLVEKQNGHEQALQAVSADFEVVLRHGKNTLAKTGKPIDAVRGQPK